MSRFMRRSLAVGAGILALAGVDLERDGARAATVAVDVTVVQPILSDAITVFQTPLMTFFNLSEIGYQVTGVRVTNGFVDYVVNRSPDRLIQAPAGGTYTPLGGTQVSSADQNDGCDPVNFGTTSFDSGDSFAFIFDPENTTCISIVVDWRNRMDDDDGLADNAAVAVDIVGPGIVGTLTLSGNDWEKELINPAGADTFDNQLYRLSLTADVETGSPTETPEPGALALLGVGLLGLAARRR